SSSPRQRARRRGFLQSRQPTRRANSSPLRVSCTWRGSSGRSDRPLSICCAARVSIWRRSSARWRRRAANLPGPSLAAGLGGALVEPEGVKEQAFINKCSPDALSCTDTARLIALQQHAPTQLHRSGDVYHASMAGPRLLPRLVRTSPGTSPHVTEIRRRHRDSGALGSFDQVTSLL